MSGRLTRLLSLRLAMVSRLKEPIREVWIPIEGGTARRLSMMRIMARRTKAAVFRVCRILYAVLDV